MTWVKVDDHFDEHPKHAQVGPLGWGVWLAGLAYCNRNLTDGFIPRAVARSLADFELVRDDQIYTLGAYSGHSGEDIDMAWVIPMLVDAGLWREETRGYRVHDYAEYQPTKDEVLEKRELNAARQQRHANKKRKANASTNALANASTDAS